MLRIAFKGLLARKLRSLLTGFAVVLGVAFVCGTFVYTDTIDESFKDLFERASKGADVQVSGRVELESGDFDEDGRAVLPQSLIAKIERIDGVDAAQGNIDGEVTLYKDGERLGSAGGAPTILSASVPERFDANEYSAGGRITEPGQIGVDQATAEREGLEIGDTLRVAGKGPARDFELAAIFKLAGERSIGIGAAQVTLPEAQALTNHGGRLDSIVVGGERGTDPEALKRDVTRTLAGQPVLVETGAEAADRQARDFADALGFLKTFLLVFGFISLLVGAFLIFNTFAITVAQRQREFALLRTIGGSRRQLLRTVVLEAAVIGLVASALGVAAGIALAPGLAAMMSAFGMELPNTGTVIAPRTLIIGLVVGTVTTLVSGIVPARRATRVDPMSALREAAAPTPTRIGPRRMALAALLLAVALAIELAGLFGGGDGAQVALLIGLGALLAIFAVALLAPLLVGPLARVIGLPLEKLTPLTGRLARENAERQPGRTAVTASALMIGVALVVFVAVLASGLKASITDTVNERAKADVIVQPDGFGGLPVAAADRLRESGDFAAVAVLRFETAGVDGSRTDTTPLAGIDPQTITRLLEIDWQRGASDAVAQRLGDRQVLVADGFADDHQLEVGSTLRLRTTTGKVIAFEVAGVFKNTVGMLSDVLATNRTLTRDWNADQAAVIFASGEGASDTAVAQAAERDLRGFPTAEVMTKQEFIDDQAKQVDQLLGLVFALLALSIMVSLMGIVNTLALAVHERTRELGMLRAVGMSRRQVRAMVRGEAVITSLLGAVLGLVLGCGFAALIAQPLADDGFVLSFPIGTLIAVAIAAGVFGVIAAISPARRAARVDVLRAVTTE